MKRFISLAFLIAAISFLSVTTAKSQEDPFKKCQSQISSAFVINSQPLQAFLTGDEVAEFRTTFLSGSVYRISTCSGKSEPILFSVYDVNRNLLFSNEDHQNTNVWDFKMAGSIECIIEAKLNSKQTTSGMALMYIGFKKLDEE